MPSTELTIDIKKKALELGFNDIGIVKPQILEKELQNLRNFLNNKFHGTLTYLERNLNIRKDIRNLYPEAQSVIMVIASYYQEQQQPHNTYKISYYTYSNDYHFIFKKKLNELSNFIISKKQNAYCISFVDTKPIFEKAYASLAGLGWIGKNTLLIHPKLGSFVFIGGIVTNIELDTDHHLTNKCSDSCTFCIDACPTKAIVKPYILDTTKCISYLTIENRNKNFIFSNPTTYIAGCDICQKVCPYNKTINPRVNKLFAINKYVNWSKEEWEQLLPTTFNIIFKNTIFKRIGYENLKRNIYLANS